VLLPLLLEGALALLLLLVRCCWGVQSRPHLQATPSKNRQQW
jgi:hypothetical protein